MAKRKTAKKAAKKVTKRTKSLADKQKATKKKVLQIIQDEKVKENKKIKKAIKSIKKTTKKKPSRKTIHPKYRIGDFVFLPPFEDNTGEYGQVQHVEEGNGMYVVKLNEKYIDEDMDDGLREVHEDQMRICLHPDAAVIKESFGTLFTYRCPACERTWDVDSSG